MTTIVHLHFLESTVRCLSICSLLWVTPFLALWVPFALALFCWPWLLALFCSCRLNFLFSSFASVAPPPAVPPSLTVVIRGFASAPSFSLSAVPCRTNVTVFPLSAEEGCLQPSPTDFSALTDPTSSAPALHAVVRHGMSPEWSEDCFYYCS